MNPDENPTTPLGPVGASSPVDPLETVKTGDTGDTGETGETGGPVEARGPAGTGDPVGPSDRPAAPGTIAGPPPRRRHGVRLRTLVFGLLLGLVAVAVLVSESTGEELDDATLGIAVLIGSGLVLLAGAVGAAGRSDR